jgi:membrane protein
MTTAHTIPDHFHSDSSGQLFWPKFYSLIGDAYRSWSDHGGPRLGAALSYYTVFSIAPLLTLVISIAGLLFGQEAVQGQVFSELQAVIGSEPAKFVQQVVVATSKTSQSVVASIIGIVVVFIGATAFFAQLQDALNVVWDVKRVDSPGFMGMLRRYWWSFSMIVGCGFLLLVSLVASAVLTAIMNFASQQVALSGLLLELVNLVVSFIVTTIIFALTFKVIPDVILQWRDVLVGAVFTAVLFLLGKTLLAIYLSHAAVASAYGAAGALVLVLLWSYYSAQLLLLGAEFTRVWRRWKRGDRVQARPGYATV